MRRHALRDDQWDRIKDLLPGREGHVDVTARDNRLFAEAVLYRYRAGIPGRDLPERFGPWKAVHTRFSRWAENGVWEKVFQNLAGRCGQRIRNDRLHDCTGASAPRRRTQKTVWTRRSVTREGGLSTKIHATVDALGNPTGFLLTPGQAQDMVGVRLFLLSKPTR